MTIQKNLLYLHRFKTQYNTHNMENKPAETSKQVMIQCTITPEMTVRVFTKKREKGAIKYSKKRVTQSFVDAEAANSFIEKLIKSGNKIRKIEICSETGAETIKPERIRKTLTTEERAVAREQKKAEREAEKAKVQAIKDAEKAKKVEAAKKAADAKKVEAAKKAAQDAAKKQAEKTAAAKAKLSEKTLA